MDMRGVKLTWLGHATFKVITPGGKTVLIDPWVAGNPACPERLKQFDKIDVMLITHGHFDPRSPREAAPAVRLLGVRAVVPMHFGTFPILVGTPEKLKELTADIAGLEIIALKPGDTLG